MMLLLLLLLAIGYSILGLNGTDACIKLCSFEGLVTWLVCADHVAWGLALQVYERATGREPRLFQGPGEARS